MNREELIKKFEKHAKKHYIKLNPNKERVTWVIDRLIENKKKHGEIYCPCRAITGNKKRDSQIICPCYFHGGEIELKGECLCRLFVKE